MKLAIVMPLWLQQTPLLDLTLRAVATIKTTAEATLYASTTRLSLCTPGELQEKLAAVFPGPVVVIHDPGVPKSVARAWNDGIRQATEANADRVLLMANDVLLEPDCIDQLLAIDSPEIDLWSGVEIRQAHSGIEDGCDFSCVMFRPSMTDRFGGFDEEFKPAYFEDNDYYVRVVLGGGHCRYVHAARFFHYGSMTKRMDPEAAHHVNHWFGLNRQRFFSKWHCSTIPHSEEQVRAWCHP